MKLVYGAVFALVLVGCQSGGGNYVPQPAPKVEGVDLAKVTAADLLPLVEGNQWTYAVNTTQMSNGTTRTLAATDVTYRVSKVEKTADGTYGTFDVIVNDDVKDRQQWMVNDKGIYQTALGKELKKYTTPQPVLLFPIPANQTFNWTGEGLQPDKSFAPVQVSSNVIGSQEIDTEIGRKSAIAIDSLASFTVKGEAMKTQSTMFLAPGVGIARFTQVSTKGRNSITQTLRLKSFSGKGQ